MMRITDRMNIIMANSTRTFRFRLRLSPPGISSAPGGVMVRVVTAGAADTVTVNGTAGVDAFTLTDAAITLGTEAVNYTSADIESLTVNGLASDDSFTVTGLTRQATLDGGAGTGDIITATNDILAKLSIVGKDLKRYSLETVEMFAQDAAAAKYTIKTRANV